MEKLEFDVWDALHMICNGDEMSDALDDEEKQMISKAADQNCRYCNGTGIFYGNETICGCTLEEE